MESKADSQNINHSNETLRENPAVYAASAFVTTYILFL